MKQDGSASTNSFISVPYNPSLTTLRLPTFPISKTSFTSKVDKKPFSAPSELQVKNLCSCPLLVVHFIQISVLLGMFLLLFVWATVSLEAEH